MEGERRIDFLKAEAKRLSSQLLKIDRELVRLCGHNGFIPKLQARLEELTPKRRKPKSKS